MLRIDRRAHDELRPVKIIPKFQAYPEGSVLIELGQTRVVCAVSIENKVPSFLKGRGVGWITAEYAMLPRSTITRTPRESTGKVGGRTHEIQRLIGRSLRAVVDLAALGEQTLTIDCDVLQADGGTRTAAITGSYVALVQAVEYLKEQGPLLSNPIQGAVAATSVGIVEGEMLLDLCYDEDCRAEADFNVVMTNKGEFVEIQGTAEGKPFSRQQIDSVLALAQKGINELFQTQRETLASLGLY